MLFFELYRYSMHPLNWSKIIIYEKHSLSIVQIACERNKNTKKRFGASFFRRRFARPSPHFQLIFCFWRIIMNSCFINTYITSQNYFKLRWNMPKHCSDATTRARLWSAVSKRGTHLADSFLMPKHSCKMCHTHPTEMFSLTNLTHFQSMIVEYNVVDLIDHFLRSHLFWTSRTLSITCSNTAATKFSEPCHATEQTPHNILWDFLQFLWRIFLVENNVQ